MGNHKLPQQVKAFILANLDLIKKDTHLAQVCVDKFKGEILNTQDSLRRTICHYRKQYGLGTKQGEHPVKRLFFDIETSPCLGWFWRPAYNTNISPNQVIEPAKIICISYKWEGDDKVQNLHWTNKQCDKKMLKDFIKVMDKADEIIGHNSDRFDEKWIRTRAIFHRIPMLPKYRSLDTLKKARSGFNFPSNRLDEIGKYLGVGRKLENERGLWDKVWQQNNRAALQRMVNYCDQDVILLEDVFHVMNSYIFNNSNFAILRGGEKYHCLECGSPHTELVKAHATAGGTIQRMMQCKSCDKNFKISNKVYIDWLKNSLNYDG